MGGSRRPYAAFLPLSLRCLLQLPPPLFSSSSVGSFVRSKPLTLPLPPRSRVGSFVGFQKEKEKCGETLGGGENLALTPSLFLVLFSSPFLALISSISLWLFLALSLRNCKSKGASAVLLPLLYHHAFSSRKKRKRRRRFCMRGRDPFLFSFSWGERGTFVTSQRASHYCGQPFSAGEDSPVRRCVRLRRGTAAVDNSITFPPPLDHFLPLLLIPLSQLDWLSGV